MRTTTLIAVTLLLIACHHGTRVKRYEPAQSPQGARIAVNTTSSDYEGELLAVRDSGVVMLRRETVLFITYGRVSEATVDGVGLAFRGGKPPDDQMKRRLKLLSRYPQGIDDALLGSLLETYAQPRLMVVQ